MGHHIDEQGRFQSDRHPELAPDKVVVSFQDERAHQALATLARAYIGTDREFGVDVMDRLTTIRLQRGLPPNPSTIVIDTDTPGGTCRDREAEARVGWHGKCDASR